MLSHKKILFLLILVGIFSLAIPFLHASNNKNTLGWLWGGMDGTGGGIAGPGWLSLNSRDCDGDGDGTVSAGEQAAHPGCPAGSIAGYGVNIPTSDGPVTGYAWGGDYGWVSFNPSDLTACPSGSCTAERSGNKLTGWARILAIRDSISAGGWTGWVKLSSAATDPVAYGVQIAGTALSGYAWSDELGYINFSGSISSPNILQICQNSCSSGVLRGKSGASGSFTMTQNSNQDVVACFNSSGDCTDSTGDVTTSVTWSDSDTPQDVVSLSLVSNKERVASGPTAGTEDISAQLGGQTASSSVSVICVATDTCGNSANTSNVCTGDTFTFTDSCGVIQTCGGNRLCDFNWKEVAP